MSAPRFVHLRVHTEYSISDSIVRIDALVEAAQADQQPALAMTDLANLFGWVKFYKAARAAGIKPICGVDAWITNETERDRPYRMLLLCRRVPAPVCAAEPSVAGERVPWPGRDPGRVV